MERVHIRNEKSITSCPYSFPNVLEVFFEHGSFISYRSLVCILNRIIPLKQLTKLVFQSTVFSFHTIVDLLGSTPEVRTLILQSTHCFTDSDLSIEQTEQFRRISETNMITNIIYDGSCTMDTMKLLVALCPRTQHLSIHLDQTANESILRFLLDRTNPNTRYLCLLCIEGLVTVWWDILNHLLKSKSILDDYTLKLTALEIYLWW